MMINISKIKVFFVLLLGLTLVMLGDVRNVISPIGYWLMWGGVAILGVRFFFIGLRLGLSDQGFQFLSFGFFLVIAGFLISSLVLSDGYTALQVAKFIVIYLYFILYFGVFSEVDVRVFYGACLVSVSVSVLVFYISKYVFADHYVLLLDGRQGSNFAYPGVLWKTTVFFAFFLIAGRFDGKANWAGSVLFFMSCTLLISDGSRTGLLWFSLVSFLTLMFWFKVQRWVRISVALSVFPFICAALLFYDGGIAGLVMLERLFQGDETRIRMFQEGFASVVECFPFGCGFGSASVEVGEGRMVLHNAYMSILGDVGILGFIGFNIIMFGWVVRYRLCKFFAGPDSSTRLYKLYIFMGLMGYAFLKMLHPFSTEMSEWGIWIIMAAFWMNISRQDFCASARVEKNI